MALRLWRATATAHSLMVRGGRRHLIDEKDKEPKRCENGRMSTEGMQSLLLLQAKLQSEERALVARLCAALAAQPAELQRAVRLTVQRTPRAMLEEVQTLEAQMQQLLHATRRTSADASPCTLTPQPPTRDVVTDETGRTEPTSCDERDTTHERVDAPAETTGFSPTTDAAALMTEHEKECSGSDEQAARLMLAAFAQKRHVPIQPLEQGGREQGRAEPNAGAALWAARGSDAHVQGGRAKAVGGDALSGGGSPQQGGREAHCGVQPDAGETRRGRRSWQALAAPGGEGRTQGGRAAPSCGGEMGADGADEGRRNRADTHIECAAAASAAARRAQTRDRVDTHIECAAAAGEASAARRAQTRDRVNTQI